jgi:hypothetical protein
LRQILQVIDSGILLLDEAGSEGNVGYPPRILIVCVLASLDEEGIGPSGIAKRVVVGRKEEVEEEGEGGVSDILKCVDLNKVKENEVSNPIVFNTFNPHPLIVIKQPQEQHVYSEYINRQTNSRVSAGPSIHSK